MKKTSKCILTVVFLVTIPAQQSSAQRWGIPGKRNSGPSPDWTLSKPQRSTYSNSRSAAPRYDASLSGRQRHYSVAPTRTQYSHPPYRGTYQSGYRAQPYVNLIYNGIGAYNYQGPYGQQLYPPGVPGYIYGLGYPTISSPPIGLQYGLRSSATYQRLPVPIAPQALPPSTISASPVVIPSNSGTTTIPAVPVPVAPPSTVDTPNVSSPIPVDDRPITNEFESAGLPSVKDVSTVDRIRSIRYQTSADDAFRRGDYASALALYEAASETAANRPTPVLRQVWALVAQKKFPAAVGQLKKVMSMQQRSEEIWVSGKDLYQDTFTSAAPQHGNALWDWLQQRPGSTDRLLLGAAFQRMRGLTGGARELVAAARGLGIRESTLRSLEALSSGQNEQLEGDISAEPEADADQGIRMKGSDLVPVPRPAGVVESSRGDSTFDTQGESTLDPVLIVPSSE